MAKTKKGQANLKKWGFDLDKIKIEEDKIWKKWLKDMMK